MGKLPFLLGESNEGVVGVPLGLFDEFDMMEFLLRCLVNRSGRKSHPDDPKL